MLEEVLTYFEALEADFQRYYGLDIRDALWGVNPMGTRRFLALVKWLPPESAFQRAMNPKGWNWNIDTELLATIAEAIDTGNRMFVMANSDKHAKKPKPIKIKRPWELEKPKSTADALRSIGAPVVYVPSEGANN